MVKVNMGKKKVLVEQEFPTSITLTLTPRQAFALRLFVGSVAADSLKADKMEVRQIADDIYRELAQVIKMKDVSTYSKYVKEAVLCREADIDDSDFEVIV